jgi:photosystem II stability/assembly factor-like uncharacterized protein
MRDQNLNLTMRKFVCTFLFLPLFNLAHAQTWKPLGPPGGDVRVLATDPSHLERIFLGTADGHIFGSEDSGKHWTLLGRASARSDAVITSIVVDPRNGNKLFASSWTRDSATEGGVYRSLDGGHTWTVAGLAGEAVRVLAMAPSDSNVLVAGTLDGVYRSNDASKSWQRISPKNHAELRNLDSIALDPHDSQIIYVGTFHLPWKTQDGGRTWSPIHQGMIDDSDVMSLLIDSEISGRIYASACSGIYRTDDSAAGWRKIQGIPYTARRTYAITQDPNHPDYVYAATSEGLWKTEDSGMTWHRTTPDSWVINAVVVSKGDPGRVLIGTEERGVLVSDDAGEHFEDANVGFEHRQIVAVRADRNRPGRILAVIADAPDSVQSSDDGGRSWSPLGTGLRSEQVLRIFPAPDNSWWISLSSGGLMRYDEAKKNWTKIGILMDKSTMTLAPNSKLKPRPVATKRTDPPLLDVVSDIDFHSNNWYAATSVGLLVSVDHGLTWKVKQAGPLVSLALQSVRVSSDERRIRVVSQRGMLYSDDAGNSWTWHDLPLESGGAIALVDQPGHDNTLVATAHNGLYISRDWGKTWDAAGSGLPFAAVQDFVATEATFVASMRTGGLFLSSDSGKTWSRASGNFADEFFTAVAASEISDRVFAASSTEGLYEVLWTATH